MKNLGRTLSATTMFFVASGAFGATLSSIEPLICNNGYSDDGSTCTTYDVGDCGSGYYELEPNNESVIAPNGTSCQLSNYKVATMPDTIVTLAYHGLLVGDEITLCNNGYAATNASTCTTYSAGDCGSGYYELEPNNESVIAPNGTSCQLSNYKVATMPDTIVTLAYHGLLVGDEITLCNHGYAATNATTCTAYTTGYCPNDYYAMSANTATFTDYDSSCASNYSVFSAESTCSYTPTASTCLDVCGNGQYTTSFGTCATLCSLGATTLRTSNGVILPMWSSSQGTPSINLGFNNGVCYVNLESGSTADSTLILDVGGTTYHAVQ